MRKGFNQIDLVFAVMITIFIIFLSFYYSSHFIQPSLNTARSLEMKYLAKGLADTVFGDLGIPGDWNMQENNVKPSLGSRIYRIPVHLSEWSGMDNNGVLVSVYLNGTDENAYNSSIIVYDGNTVLDTELKNMVDGDSDGFLEEVNVTFNVTVPAWGEKLVYIYYSRDNETYVTYQTLSEAGNTINVTEISAERYIGLTTSKMSALSVIPLQEAGEKFGFDYPFRLVVEKTGGSWEYGYELAERETSVNRRKVLLQNSTGQIESAGATVYVWK